MADLFIADLFNRPMNTIQSTMHQPLLILPMGGGPIGRWAHLTASGCTWPGSLGFRSSHSSPNPRPSSRVGLQECQSGQHNSPWVFFPISRVKGFGTTLGLANHLGLYQATNNIAPRIICVLKPTTSTMMRWGFKEEEESGDVSSAA